MKGPVLKISIKTDNTEKGKAYERGLRKIEAGEETYRSQHPDLDDPSEQRRMKLIDWGNELYEQAESFREALLEAGFPRTAAYKAFPGKCWVGSLVDQLEKEEKEKKARRYNFVS